MEDFWARRIRTRRPTNSPSVRLTLSVSLLLVAGSEEHSPSPPPNPGANSGDHGDQSDGHKSWRHGQALRDGRSGRERRRRNEHRLHGQSHQQKRGGQLHDSGQVFIGKPKEVMLIFTQFDLLTNKRFAWRERVFIVWRSIASQYPAALAFRRRSAGQHAKPRSGFVEGSFEGRESSRRQGLSCL